MRTVKLQLSIALSFVLSFALTAAAADYRAEALKDAPPVDELSEEIAAQIGSEGLKVIRGTKSTLCEIWPCKEWKVNADFKPAGTLLYPFEPGQLLGALRYGRRGADFRDQQMSRGVYTIRYGVRPQDGNHEGTSPTLDFLLLVRAEDDESAEPMDPDELNELSAEAAESSHPATLFMLEAEAEAGDAPTIRHDEDQDWWIVRFAGKAVAGDQTKQLPLEVVVVGIADE